MRYLTSQQMVVSLLDELQLATRAFPMGDAKNLLYLRRKHLRVQDFPTPKKVPYKLDWNERGKSPSELLLYAIDTAVPHAIGKTPVQWEAIKETTLIDGRHLYNIGFWNLLYKILSSEGYNLVLDAGGYFSILSNWNAGEAMPWILADFPMDVQYRTLCEGCERLPQKLSEGLEKRGDVRTSYRLQSFALPPESDEQGLITLLFRDETTQVETLVQTRRLILAMPKRALELLDQHNAFFRDPHVIRCLNAVTAQPAFKLFLGYEHPWWRVLGLQSGRSITDLPIRQTYYFGTEGEQEGNGVDKRNQNSLLMAGYSDGLSVGFWSGLLASPDHRIPLFDGHENPFVGDRRRYEHLPPSRKDEQAAQDQSEAFERANPGKKFQDYKVTTDLVDMAHYQLQQMHGLEFYMPKPYTAVFKDWRADPYGGGWHFWNVDVKPWAVMKEMRHPVKHYHVYVCGEAYSNNQGWVEGALRCTELMLQEYFGLRRPAWLPEGYYLGPRNEQ